jgi:hypothetical protein
MEKEKMSLSPKEIYLRTHAAEAEELRKHRESTWFTVTAVFAYSQLAFSGASEQQLLGAQSFINVFQQLHEKPAVATKFPAKRLEVDFPDSKPADKPIETKK